MLRNHKVEFCDYVQEKVLKIYLCQLSFCSTDVTKS